ncbi:MAG: 50S ribosomal protein L21 [Clostridia bacterium]|nr:50S ribosomal protein L21 [Clostridia bacterium]
MDYAIVVTGGKQYKVTEGEKVFIELIGKEADEAVVFDKVLAVSNGDEVTFGAPYVEGATVDAKVVKNGKDKKIMIIKHKAKKGYRKRQGHRQPYTQVIIEKINA